MSIYTPDKWVMLKITNPEYVTYKVMASWYGGFHGSNSWKLSSGTVSQKDPEEGVRDYLQDSGSIYRVIKDNYGMSAYTQSVYNGFSEGLPAGFSIEIMTLMEVWEIDPVVFGAWK